MHDTGWERWLARAYYAIAGLHYLTLQLAGAAVLLSGVSLTLLAGIARWFCLGIATIAGIVAAFAAAQVRSRRLSGSNPYAAISGIHERLIIYAETKFLSVRRLTFRATRHGLDNYTEKFYWTGDDTIVPTLLAPSTGRLTIGDEEFGSRKVLRIHFASPLRAGESIYIAYSLALQGVPSPHLSVQNRDLIAGPLVLRVDFPDLAVRTYRRLLFRSSVSDIAVWSEEVQTIAGQGFADWIVHRPRTGYRYVLRW